MTGQGWKRRVVTVGLVVVTCGSMWLVQGTGTEAAMLLLEWAPPPSDLGATPPRAPDLIAPMKIGPVEGLTTGWHAAPAKTAIPLGTLLQLRQHAPLGATVTWTGAVEVMRDESGSTAECPLEAIGKQIVRVTLEQPGRERLHQSIRLDVVDISADEVRVGPIHVAVEPLDLDENSTNEETMRYFFRSASIAALRELGENRYRTSIHKPLLLKVEVQPPAFAPLIEWRIDGAPRILGASVQQGIDVIGNHSVTAGPAGRSNVVHVETYGVTITSHRSNYDFVSQGEPIIFEAVTDPLGYEDEITWLSSTKYGTGIPVLGSGATFTAQFDDTWGPHPDGGDWQWLGARADYATFSQDQKQQLVATLCGVVDCQTLVRVTLGGLPVGSEDGLTWSIIEGQAIIDEDPFTKLSIFRPQGTVPVVATPAIRSTIGKPTLIGIDPQTVPPEERSILLAGGGLCDANPNHFSCFALAAEPRSVVWGDVVPLSSSERVVIYKIGQYYALDPVLGLMRITANPDFESRTTLRSLGGPSFFPASATSKFHFIIDMLQLPDHKVFNPQPMVFLTESTDWPPFGAELTHEAPVEFFFTDMPEVSCMTIKNQSMQLYEHSYLDIAITRFDIDAIGELNADWSITNNTANDALVRWFVFGNLGELNSRTDASVTIGAGETVELTFASLLNGSTLTQAIVFCAVSLEGPRLHGEERVQFEYLP